MKVLAIHDLSGFGRAALTTIIPVLAVNKHQCVPVPTAIFSTHTAIKNFRMHDLTSFIDDYIEHFHELNIDFSCIYSGFLASEAQIDSVVTAHKKFPKALVVVDPVMGDEGHVYKTYTSQMCQKMKYLVKHADIITPNVTEAKILLDIDVKTEINTKKQVEDLLLRLSDISGKIVIITGIHLDDTKITTAIYNDGKISYYEVSRLNSYYPGTGDLFTTVLVSKFLNGFSLEDSVKTSCDFVYKSIEYTNSLKTEPLYGVEFECLLEEFV